MKLYKIDFTNTIGDYMVTVPTDSQFLIGISNGDSEADVELLDGETEITPEDEKIGAYTVFKFETDGTPFKKQLKATISKTEIEEETETILYTQKINIIVKCVKMSVAYRDFEGNGGGTFSPCVIDSTTPVVQVTPDNLATIERTIYTASVDAEDFSISKSVTFDIDEDAFTAAGVNCNNAVWEFKVLFEIPVVEEGVLPGDWSETTAPNLVSFRTKNGENLGNLGGVSLLFGDGEMELVTQYLVVPGEVTKRVGITIRLFRSFDAFDDNLCARLFYLAHDI